MANLFRLLNRVRTKVLLVGVLLLALYLFILDPSKEIDVPDHLIDVDSLQQEVEIGTPVKLVSYKSPLDEKLFIRDADKPDKAPSPEADLKAPETSPKHREAWLWADQAIGVTELFPDAPEIDNVLTSLATAKIVNVDVLYMGDYESGTSEKWVATLEGGQRAMMKLLWEGKGDMKRGGLCNYGFEMPTAEIAAFHLHRILGFRNTPYVSGRRVDLRREILPVASPPVAKQIHKRSGEEVCVTAKCHFCKQPTTICPKDGIVEVSMAYWIPRKMKLFTYPPEYMPYSTPSMAEWKQYGFNNHTYCHKIRRVEPYNIDYYYHDLFDFAVLDSMMYHYDSKHYALNDKNSPSHGMTVKLDNGRAFCAHDRDEEHVFMAPLTQCCKIRRSSWEKLEQFRGEGKLTRSLREALDHDPIAPVLRDPWYPALERRLNRVFEVMERCAKANGWDNVLIPG